MKNSFYKHLVIVDPIHEKFNEVEIADDERQELMTLFHSHVHFTVIDIILSELTEEKKKEFLHLLAIREDNTGAWEFVLTHIENGESKIKEAIDLLAKQFLIDLEAHQED